MQRQITAFFAPPASRKRKRASDRCVNGAKRGKNTAAFDRRLDDGRREEWKSAQLKRNKHTKYWWVQFQCIKPDCYDVLRLVVYSPRGLDVFTHDGRSGMSTRGKQTKATGSCISFRGPRNEHDWARALDVVLGKMSARMERVLSFRFDDVLPRGVRDVLVQRTRTAIVYDDVPLAHAAARGRVLERICRNYFETRPTRDAHGVSRRVNGRKNGRNAQPYDYEVERGGGWDRVEVKSAQLKWNKHKKRWLAHFSNIKPDCYDVLRLVVYSPRGLDVFTHDGRSGMSTSGKQTKASGSQVAFYGPCNEHDWARALDVVLIKMSARNARLGAPYAWATRDPTVVRAVEQTPTGTVGAYDGVPLSSLSGQARGDVLERVGCILLPSATRR